MKRVLVIADDLTGAAEIAGIAHSFGFAAQVARASCNHSTAPALAFDTDSRSLPPATAAKKVADSLRLMPPAGSFDLIYKKVDSVLRGPIAAEILALMRALQKPRALLIPENPSKGRIIVNGEYQMHGTPLDQTNFRHDPEYPRTSSRVATLLSSQVTCANPGQPLAPVGITVGCASSDADIRRWASLADDQTLLAGGADFFSALLAHRGLTQRDTPLSSPNREPLLIIAGSSAASSRDAVKSWANRGTPISPMPTTIYDHPDADLQDWLLHARNLFQTQATLVLAIQHPVLPDRAARLKQALARAAKSLLSDHHAQIRVYMDGGATAAAVVEELRWSTFNVERNIAPGVVAMRPTAAPQVLVIIKPGSYPWPDGFPENF